MLTRVVTAAILAIAVLAAILWLPFRAFFALNTLLMLWAAWEWSGLMHLSRPWQRALYLIVILAVFYACVFVPPLWVLLPAALWWFVAAVSVALYRGGPTRWSRCAWAVGAMGILTITPAWLAINALRIAVPGGAINLLWLLLLVWAADIGAFFAGRRWGSRKLAAHVSPGKTWEGLAGGLAAVIAVALLLCLFNPDRRLAIIVISLLTAIFAVIGDLTESLCKREAGIKDSGRLLPGHGGLLDRIDSLLAAAPIFLLLLHVPF